MTAEHILVVEDEKKIADILNDYLTKEGFKVSLVGRGDEVIEEVKRISPALMLLDLMLPGLDGISICREIRKVSNLPHYHGDGPRVEEIGPPDWPGNRC